MKLEISFRSNVEECLKALVEYGDYGDTIEEVIRHMINHKIFRLKDVKDATIWGLLKRGKDKGWIVQNIPDLRDNNKRAYDAFLKQAELEGLPDDICSRLEEEKRRLEERK